jgi:hypothetical protein
VAKKWRGHHCLLAASFLAAQALKQTWRGGILARITVCWRIDMRAARRNYQARRKTLSGVTWRKSGGKSGGNNLYLNAGVGRQNGEKLSAALHSATSTKAT